MDERCCSGLAELLQLPNWIFSRNIFLYCFLYLCLCSFLTYRVFMSLSLSQESWKMIKDTKWGEMHWNVLCRDVCRTPFSYVSMHYRWPSQTFSFLYMHVPVRACIGAVEIFRMQMCVSVVFIVVYTGVWLSPRHLIWTEPLFFQSKQLLFNCLVLEMYVQYLYVNILYPYRLFIPKSCITWMIFFIISNFFFYPVCLRCTCYHNWTVDRRVRNCQIIQRGLMY